jgi:peptidoglycan/xylan/chitin deacetylase (PgdA/CDA1 family)
MSARSLRSRVARVVKVTLAHALYYTLVLDALLAWKLRRGGIVLMYHRVLPPGADSFSSPAIVVTPATFALHMRVLRSKLRPLDAAGLEAALASGSLPARTCCVTFDDGWFDNRTHALPILARERVPALMFVATNYIDSADCFWQERVSRLLFEAWRAGERATAALAANGLAPLAGTAADAVRASIGAIVMEKKRLPVETLLPWIDALAQALAGAGIQARGNGDDRFMSWTDVTALARSGVVTVGSHACSHLPLHKLDRATRQRELDDSRRQIESHTGQSVRSIAYPDGGHDDATVEDTGAAGYALAFTTVRGTIAAGDAPLRLSRVNIAENGTGTTAEFLCRLAGIL